MIPFPMATLLRQPPSGSIITNLRKTAGDEQSGTDRRILAGDEAGNTRKTQETL
jgi:hypothetical protein